MRHKDIMLGMDEIQVTGYLGQLKSYDVLRAYEAVFGSVQVLAYERDLLKYIANSYFTASQEEQERFCDALDGEVFLPSVKRAKAAKRKIWLRETILRLGCRLSRSFFHK